MSLKWPRIRTLFYTPKPLPRAPVTSTRLNTHIMLKIKHLLVVEPKHFKGKTTWAIQTAFHTDAEQLSLKHCARASQGNGDTEAFPVVTFQYDRN
jgi:hypothetical protein